MASHFTKSPDVIEVLAELRAVYRQAMDYLDHADLAAFVEEEERHRANWLEEVTTILDGNTKQRALRGKRGLIV